MNYEWNNGQCELLTIQEMEGFLFAIKFFDDDTKLFLSPSLLEQMKNGKLERLDFFTLNYHKNSKSIVDIVEEIKKESLKR